MIRSITSTLASFKEVKLRSGLNLIVAHKAPSAGMKDTRNKAGKSSLVQLIHFLFGGEGSSDSIFRDKKLSQHRFTMEADLSGARVRITRSGETFGSTLVELVSGSFDAWPLDPRKQKQPGVFKTAEWQGVLGCLFFGLPVKKREAWAPSYSSLFNYFARRDRVQGFGEAQAQSKYQQPADQRIALSYLIGLNWRISQAREVLREELNQVKKVAKEERLTDFLGDAGELRATATTGGSKAARIKKALDSFEVLEDYKGREQEASALTEELNELANRAAMDALHAEELKASLEAEAPPDLRALKRLYKRAGIELPGLVVRRFEQAQAFHQSVIDNRRAHVNEELRIIKKRQSERAARQRDLSSRYEQTMTLLRTHGALERYEKLAAEYAQVLSKTNEARERLNLVNEIADKEAHLELREKELVVKLREDFRDKEGVIQQSILAFEHASESLYKDAGSLSIEATDAGPAFKIVIQGEKSRGVTSVQIFCFDMMLFQIATKRGMSPGFVVHDSQLFDAVDGRQVFEAWRYGSQLTDDIGGQYIVTINSDQLPAQDDREGDFHPEDYIVEPRLTDEESGRLFGLTFG